MIIKFINKKNHYQIKILIKKTVTLMNQMIFYRTKKKNKKKKKKIYNNNQKKKYFKIQNKKKNNKIHSKIYLKMNKIQMKRYRKDKKTIFKKNKLLLIKLMSLKIILIIISKFQKNKMYKTKELTKYKIYGGNKIL